MSWIKDGAKNDSKLNPEFERLEIVPPSLRFTESGQTQRLQAIVHWKDGSIEDVTQLTRFRSNDESIATVNEIGIATATVSGDTHIIAFYDNGIQPVPGYRPVSDKLGDAYPEAAATSEVDQLIVAKLRTLGVVPSEAKCADKYAILRGVNHTLAAHRLGAEYLMTGNRPLPSLKYPTYGAVISKELGGPRDIPRSVAIPK